MKQLFMALFVFLGAAGTAAASLPPDELVKQTTNEVIAELEENRHKLENNPEKLYRMVDEIVLPHLDFERMSRYVLGKHWREASPGQQEAFIDEFKTLLVRTYATALFEYTGQDIHYKPFRQDEGDNRALVQTEVRPQDGPAIPIDYALIRNSEQWKVYDIKIDGLSLVTNYRAQYGRIIQSQGVDELIASLSAKNQKLTNSQ